MLKPPRLAIRDEVGVESRLVGRAGERAAVARGGVVAKSELDELGESRLSDLPLSRASSIKRGWVKKESP